MRALLICIGLLASAVSFPAMLFERAVPKMPPDARLITEGSSFHWAKNLTTECYRADPQWWSKCSAFAVLSLAILSIIFAVL
jgi:hypothetical protein